MSTWYLVQTLFLLYNAWVIPLRIRSAVCCQLLARFTGQLEKKIRPPRIKVFRLLIPNIHFHTILNTKVLTLEKFF
jgi:hypothetical protein